MPVLVPKAARPHGNELVICKTLCTLQVLIKNFSPYNEHVIQMDKSMLTSSNASGSIKIWLMEQYINLMTLNLSLSLSIFYN